MNDKIHRKINRFQSVSRKMHVCCAYGCGIKQRNESNIVSFHRIPSNEEQRKSWIKAIPFAPGKNPSKNLFLCSSHFKKEDFLSCSTNVKKILKKHVIPSIFNDPLTKDKSELKTEQRLICERRLQKIFVAKSQSSQSMDKSETQIKVENVQLKMEIDLEIPSKKAQLSNKCPLPQSPVAKVDSPRLRMFSDLVKDVHRAKRKMDLQLKKKRTKNCRLRSKIEKLTAGLIEVREDFLRDHPALGDLYENALKDIDSIGKDDDISGVEIATEDENNSTRSKVEDRFTAFGVYLANELKTFPYEEINSLKDEIRLLISLKKDCSI